MHRQAVPETLDAVVMSSRSSRAPSISSDRHSIASSVTLHMPTTVRPAPAYIAASVASQIVTDAHNAQLRDENSQEVELASAVFDEPALALLNAFLDHLLFAFLSKARSPTLSAMRPAIADVLKPRLAREAIDAADEELDGLLAADDDDADELALEGSDGRAADRWDVEKVWKRTRLRIMVYTRLGELEDDDEERYVQQERGLSMDDDDAEDAGLVSWAAAIFLTSVVEYVAEQALLISGAAAHARVATRIRKLSHHTNAEVTPVLAIERLVIEEPDAEKIALNAALGRLWRTWRKRVRSPGRGVRPISSSSSLYHSKANREIIEEPMPQEAAIPEHMPTETEIASNIPLPQGDNDVNEIEVPGLANAFDDDHVDPETTGTPPSVSSRPRPQSVIISASIWPYNTMSWRQERPTSLPIRPAPRFVPSRPSRPSHPSSTISSPISVPTSASNNDDLPFETPMERIADANSFLEETDHEDMHQHREAARKQLEIPAGPDASQIAVATPAAAMGIVSRISPVQSAQTQDRNQRVGLDQDGVGHGIPTRSRDQNDPTVSQPDRVSIEESYPPDIVRSISRPFNHEPVAPRDYKDQKTAEIAPAPTPGFGSSYAQRKALKHTAPQAATPTSVLPANIPTFDPMPVTPVEPAPAQPTQTKKHSIPTKISTGSSAHAADTMSPAHRRESPASTPRNRPVPIMQDTDSSKVKVAPPHLSPTRMSASSLYNPKRSPTRSAESLVAGAGQRNSTSGSPLSQAFSHDRSLSDKASLKRVISSSSAQKSNGAIPISSGRDSTASRRSRNLSGRMSEEDREREFDSLVKGKDTVKFTLTPENMRALDAAPTNQAEPPKPSSVTSHVTVYPRVNAEDSQFGTANLPPKRTFSKSRRPGPTVASHRPSPSRTVISKPVAREARIDTESLRELAEFIRSTGPPPGSDVSAQPFVAKSMAASSSAHGSTLLLGRNGSASQQSSRVDGASSRTRMNMEPRSPAGPSNGNDDLIDFIRQGPPNANAGQPRIPRSVAPFRTTVDSDQFDTMLAGHDNVESAFGSTTSTVDTKYSDTTVHSRTGLIPDPVVVQPAYSNAPQQLSGSMASNEPTITRTHRRVKDPYAIDMSDEDEEEDDDDRLTALPASSRPPQSAQASRQETLADFLNGMDPPSNSQPQPFALNEQSIAAARARATSNSSPASSTTAPRNGPVVTGLSSSISSDAPRAYKPKLQARAPAVGHNGRSATSDLADFLRESGPPDVPQGQNGNAQFSATKKDEDKKSFKFWKRGKSEKT